MQVKAGHMLKFKSEFSTKKISWHPNSLEFSLFECSRTLWLKLHLQRNGTERAGQRCGQFSSRIVSLSGNIFTILTNLHIWFFTTMYISQLRTIQLSYMWAIRLDASSWPSMHLFHPKNFWKKRAHYPGTQTRGTRLPKVVSGVDISVTWVGRQIKPGSPSHLLIEDKWGTHIQQTCGLSWKAHSQAPLPTCWWTSGGDPVHKFPRSLPNNRLFVGVDSRGIS